ncbi:MAG: shikimate kinase [Chitinophagaceae bacterium]|nr:MAG: shikimate kinase [Chitinophagaceae bacterium]
MRIYIVGFMGSGKSTFGAQLATELGFGFTDLDTQVEEIAGQSVASVFEDKGEEFFRKLESEALSATEKLENHVIATGGGTPVFNHQAEWMNDNGTTVYLKLFESELSKRLSAEMALRPLLKDQTEETLPEFVYNMLRERAFYYQQAQIVIDPLHFSPKELAAMLKGEVKAEAESEI